MSRQVLEELYLDYFNNFLTVAVFAEHYGFTEKKALTVIKLGRAINNAKGAA